MIITNIYLFIMAVVLAVLEIQIEGQHGWAKNLPTWRPHSSRWYSKLYKKIMSGKELTGYHLSMFIFVFMILNLPYVFGLPLTRENFSKTMALFIIFSAVWDFLWFVLNPYYPLKQFKKEYLDFHHPRWFLGLPADYYFAVLGSFLVILPVAYFNHNIFAWWGVNLGLFIIQILIVILFSLYILKIDNWHNKK